MIERHKLRNEDLLENLADVLCSSVGSLNNPTKLANTIQSVKQQKADRETVEKYLSYLEDSFLFESVKRYDIEIPDKFGRNAYSLLRLAVRRHRDPDRIGEIRVESESQL